MASITRTKKESVATVTANAREITVTNTKALTIAESKELLKAAEEEAGKQTSFDPWHITLSPNTLGYRNRYFSGAQAST